MKVLDLFSGIGGFSLGLEWAGMSTVAFCERDPYCTTILNKHWPDTPVHNDVRNLDGKEYAESIDLVAGGFPCQPFSVAGNRRGSDDDRHLWPEMLRIIQEAKPRWVIGENVFGLINMALDDVQADLEREHYEVRKFVLPAVAVDAHHRRDRIFIIAYRDPALVNASSEHGRRDTDRRGGAGMEMGGDVLAQTRRHQVPDATDRPSTHVAHSHGEGQLQQEGFEREVGRWSGDSGEQGSHVADAYGEGLQRHGQEHQLRGFGQEGQAGGSGDVAYTNGARGEVGVSGQESWQEGHSGESHHQGDQQLRRSPRGEWPVEPRVGRVADGIPNRVDRIKGLGNAVVPQLIQAIGELVLAADKEIYGCK
jgi:DNA (cytosine-5)-methyltransferase 1